MLGELLRDTRHISRKPCENVPILTEEVDELAFLFGTKVSPHGDELGVIVVVQENFLRVVCQLETGLSCRLNRLWHCRLLFADLAFDLAQLLAAYKVSAIFAFSEAQAMERL